MAKYILAHDLGTSGNKAALFSLEGKLGAGVLYEYPAYYPKPGWVEQDPNDFWKAVCLSTRQLLEKASVSPGDIAAVCFSGQMMGCLLVDGEGRPLRPMIIWADTRAGAQEAEMKEKLGMDYIYRTTGHRISASYSAAKLLWVRDNEGEIYKRAYKMLHAKDYIIFKLTGKFVTDYSDASGTNLFDLVKKTWDKNSLDALSIPPDLLPDPYPSTYNAGGITLEAAGEIGLLQGTPVIIGGGDGSCACVGAGVVAEGAAYNVLGSSSWISLASTAPLYDPRMRTFTWVHLDPALYTPCGTMQAAGYSYNWYKNTLCGDEIAEAARDGEDPYRIIDEGALKSPPGAGGLLYLPYLLGERSPRWNHEARGAFVGLSITTGKSDISRAVLEGVGFNLRIILEILEDRGNGTGGIIMIGGGAKGTVWLQILADIWQKPLVVPAYTEEATSLGAAVCGGVGIGAFRDFSVIRQFNGPVKTISPRGELAPVYEELFGIFNQAYDSMTGVYHRLAEFGRRA
ncbi:MAG: FGGY-family carbohydrate kinase [Spirochaetaceae bacterium]|jgi:xylulokinase|nr:FGGY-family carbohydrate kinase [Spirochaetaceae bacterium]